MSRYKLVLLVAVLLLSMAPVSAEGLEGYWRFDDPEVSRGHSLEFQNSYSTISQPDNLPTGDSAFTTSFWVKDTGSNDDGALLGWGTTSDSSANGQELRDGGWQHYFYGNDLDCYNLGLEDGKWHHLAVTFDPVTDNRSMYFDGELKCTDNPGTVNVNGTDVQIGRAPSSSTLTEAAVDDVKIYSRDLSESEIKDLHSGENFLQDSLVMHHNFNEGPTGCDLTSSNSCLADSSGNENDGMPQGFSNNDLESGEGWLKRTPVNRPSIRSHTGNNSLNWFSGGLNGDLQNFNFTSSSGWSENSAIGDKSLRFDGEDDLVEIEHSERLEMSDTGNFTISGWVYLNDTSKDTWERLLEKGSFGEGGYSIQRGNPSGDPSNDKEIDFYFAGSSGWQNSVTIVTPSNNDLNNWHFFTVTVQGDTVKTYFDAELTNQASGWDYTATERPLILGNSGGGGYLTGKLDDIRFYRKALTSSQINTLYNNKSISDGITGRWNFEAGDREKAYDTAGFGASGILGTSALGPGSSRNISTRISLNETFTASAWVNPSGTEWGDIRYRYRKHVEIRENSSRHLRNYQINFTIDTASLIQEGKLNEDCSDLKFFSQTGVRLYHDVVSGCNTASTELIVEVRDIPANQQRRIAMYYGSSSEGGENPEKAYYVYDLFGSGYDGTLTGDANYNEDQEFVELTENVDGQSGSLNYTNGTPAPGWKASWEYYIGNGTDADALWLYGWASGIPSTEDADGNSVNWILNDHDDCIGVGNNTQCGNFGSWTENPATSQWEKASAYGYRNGSQLHFSIQTLGNETSGSRKYTNFSIGDMFGFGARTGGKNNYHWLRKIKIQKYSEPTPSVSIKGEEKRPEVLTSENITLTASEDALYFKSGKNFVYSEREVKNWQLITGVFNGSALELYLGGEKVGVKNSDTSLSKQNIALARNYYGGIEEMRVYDRDLSSEEVKRLGFK